MARLVLAFLIALITGTQSGFAQSGEPDLRGVGLIDFGLAGGCTGTLIEADLVLTAGHCLWSHVDAAQATMAQITFHPTLSNGTHQKGFVVSFRGRGGGPARQRACLKIATNSGVVELGCQVSTGESGAPFLVFSGGQLQVMAVITRRWRNKAQPTALAVESSASLAGLMEAYNSARN